MSNDNPNQVISQRIYYFSGGSIHSESIEGGDIDVHGAEEFKEIMEEENLRLDDLNEGFVENLENEGLLSLLKD